MLRVSHINEHKRVDKERYDDDEHIFVSDIREPSLMRQKVYDPYIARSALVPSEREICHNTYCDVVHHKREQRLVRSEKRLEDRRYDSPDYSRKDAGHYHKYYYDCVRQYARQEFHARDSDKTSDEDLSVRAHVPEFHLERGYYRKSEHKQDRGVFHQRPNVDKRAFNERRVYLERIFMYEYNTHYAAYHERDEYARQANEKHIFVRHMVSFGNVEQRLVFCFFSCHRSALRFVRPRHFAIRYQ